MFPPLPTEKYDIIYADPPWDYQGRSQFEPHKNVETSSANRYYETVTLSMLKDLGVKDIAATDCLLFMWSTNPHLDQAIDLGKHWGFKWATVAFVWYKQRGNPGYYTHTSCELCLVFKKGKIPQPRGARNIKQFLSEKRSSRHSEKPKEIRERISLMFPEQKKIELFARDICSGWDSWGNEECEVNDIRYKEICLI